MQEGDARPGDMQDKDRKERNRKRGNDSDAPEIGVVRVFSNPGPDAPDRLRRLLSLMVRYATHDGQEAPENDSPAEESQTEDHDEAEA